MEQTYMPAYENWVSIASSFRVCPSENFHAFGGLYVASMRAQREPSLCLSRAFESL